MLFTCASSYIIYNSSGGFVLPGSRDLGQDMRHAISLQDIANFLKGSHFITGVHPFLGTKVVTPSSRRTSSPNLPVTTLCSNCGPRTCKGNESRQEDSSGSISESSEGSLAVASIDDSGGRSFSHTLRPWRLFSVKPQARRSSERYQRR